MDKRKQSREAAKKRKRGKNLSKPLEIWEIQQSLKRGEFVEVKLSVQCQDYNGSLTNSDHHGYIFILLIRESGAGFFPRKK